MKNTKRCFVLFSFYDHTGIEAYLERQAENGWMLDKTSAFGWRFRRIEPEKINFSVVYFSKASAFDPEPSEGQLCFQDFCEHTGWKLAASNAQMQIFYNEADNPTPISTDAAMEVAAVHESAKKSFLPGYYLLMGAVVLQAGLFIWRLLSDPIEVLASNANLFSGMSWVLIALLSLVEIIGYFRWYRKAKEAAELNGSFVETKGHQNFQAAVLCFMFLAYAFLLIPYGGSKWRLIAFVSIGIVLGIIAIIAAASELMKKLKFSAKINRNITILLTLVVSFGFMGLLLLSVVNRIFSFLPEKTPVDTYEYNGQIYHVYADELPLTIEDLIVTDYDEYSYELYPLNQSVFVEQKEAIQCPRYDAPAQPELEYSVTTIKAPLLYGWCKTALLKDFAHNYGRPAPEDDMWKEHIEIDAVPWGANEAYQLKRGGEPQMRFLLCYDNRIVEINFEHDWKLTAEQMKVIGEKLNTQ